MMNDGDDDLQGGFGSPPNNVEVNLQTQELKMTQNVNKIIHPFR